MKVMAQFCISTLNSAKVEFTVLNRLISYRKFYRIQVCSTCHTNTKSTSPAENSTCDLIGPPDPDSNLRSLRIFIPENESAIEKEFRLKHQEVQKWNQEFWASHNKKFIKERKKFIAANQLQNNDTPLSADEMSVFYKSFLDKTWKTHVYYNFKWYKKNAQLVCLQLKVKPKFHKPSLSSENLSRSNKSEECSLTSRSVPANLKKDKGKLCKEAFHKWLESKNIEQRLKQEKEQKTKTMIEEQNKIKKETAELSFELWKHEKIQQKRENELKNYRLKEEQERQKSLKQQTSRERVSQWMNSSKHKPRPVPSNMGLLSLTGSNPPSFFNPCPWATSL